MDARIRSASGTAIIEKKMTRSRRALFFVMAFAPFSGAWGDELTRRAQEELRRRNIFFGDIDGRSSPEFSAAVNRFQERKGLATTGSLDNETLHSLGVPATRKPDEPQDAWPNVTVLRSEQPRFREGAQPERSPGPPPIAEATIATVDAEVSIAPERVRDFIQAYLRDAENNDVAAEAKYYADPLDYFDHGIVNLRFVERDVQNYYTRWPERKYELLSLTTLPVEGRKDQIRAKFRLHFTVTNADHSVSGVTENLFTLQADESNLRIVSVREQRVRP